MNATRETLKALSLKYLSEGEQPGIDFYLENRELELVSVHILGVIDSKWKDGLLGDDEAREVITALDLGPKDMAHLKVESECLRKLF